MVSAYNVMAVSKRSDAMASQIVFEYSLDVHYANKGINFGKKAAFEVGDVIGTGIDQFSTTITFFKNGKKVQSEKHSGYDSILPMNANSY